MLKRLVINRFRSCRGVAMDFDQAVALVGRNGAGKTNLLQAIDWLGSHAREADTFPTYGGETGDISAEFECDGVTYVYSVIRELDYPKSKVSESITQIQNGVSERIVERTDDLGRAPNGREFEVGLTSSICFVLRSITPPESELGKILAPLWSDLLSVRYIPLDEPSQLPVTPLVSKSSLSPEPLFSFDPKKNISTSLVELHQKRPKDFEKLIELIGPEGLGLVATCSVQSLGEIQVTSSKTETFYYIHFLLTTESEYGVSFERLSLGTRRVIRLIFALLVEPNAIRLIEHPEDGIHRGLMKKVISILLRYSAPGQIILASHSPVVVDRMRPNTIRLVSMVNGATQVRALSDQELQLAKGYLEDEGTLSDFIQAVTED